MRKAYYFHGNPIRFYCKKHNCPICNRQLKIIMHHKTINSKSDEVEKYSSLSYKLIPRALMFRSKLLFSQITSNIVFFMKALSTISFISFKPSK